jgi:hypothetical protein
LEFDVLELLCQGLPLRLTHALAPQAHGSTLCAYQYFENVRNFLTCLQDLGLPTFEVSDLEKVTLSCSVK